MVPIKILVGPFTVNRQVVNVVTRLNVKLKLEALQQGVWPYSHVLVELRNTHSGMKSSWMGGGGGVLRRTSGA